MIPLSYILRNLLRRITQSIQLILGSFLVVFLICIVSSINQSMEITLGKTGDPQNLIILGAGSEESVERSEVKPGVKQIIASSIKGIKSIMGKPAVSPEVHFNGTLMVANGNNSQALIRGVSHEALWVHQAVRIIEGRFPDPGEVMVGRLAYQILGIKKSDLQVGGEIIFNEEKLIISGIFDAIGTVMEAEVWMPLQDLMTYTQRENLSCVVLKLSDYESVGDIDAFTKRRLDLEITALQEAEYYKKINSFYAPIRWMAWVCAILLSTAALFGGLNSLYAAFYSRSREFATMQAIGFTRARIFISLLKESCLISFTGALLALLCTFAFLQDVSIPFSIGVFVLNFNETIFINGIIVALFLGIIGGTPPAWNCLKPNLTEMLRSN